MNTQAMSVLDIFKQVMKNPKGLSSQIAKFSNLEGGESFLTDENFKGKNFLAVISDIMSEESGELSIKEDPIFSSLLKGMDSKDQAAIGDEEMLDDLTNGQDALVSITHSLVPDAEDKALEIAEEDDDLTPLTNLLAEDDIEDEFDDDIDDDIDDEFEKIVNENVPHPVKDPMQEEIPINYEFWDHMESDEHHMTEEKVFKNPEFISQKETTVTSQKETTVTSQKETAVTKESMTENKGLETAVKEGTAQLTSASKESVDIKPPKNKELSDYQPLQEKLDKTGPAKDLTNEKMSGPAETVSSISKYNEKVISATMPSNGLMDPKKSAEKMKGVGKERARDEGISKLKEDTLFLKRRGLLKGHLIPSYARNETGATVKTDPFMAQEFKGNIFEDPKYTGAITTPHGQSKVHKIESRPHEMRAFHEVKSDDVIRQMVDKMSLGRLKSQPEMKIRLKPEFLGNLRLNITTSNQQVMVKVMTDTVMVKDMIESNLTQLKTELSSYGLEIDKFDVFVGQDSHFSGSEKNTQDSGRFNSQNDTPKHAKNMSHQKDSEGGSKEQPKQPKDDTRGIDYFA